MPIFVPPMQLRESESQAKPNLDSRLSLERARGVTPIRNYLHSDKIYWLDAAQRPSQFLYHIVGGATTNMNSESDNR